MTLSTQATSRKDSSTARTAELQHRHFAVIAAIIRNELEHVACGEDQRNMVRSVADAFARRLASTNPRFNRARFLRACGVED
jgi:tryptophanyl-tRNA synthetase